MTTDDASIQRRAERDLIFTYGDDQQDVFLWEHSLRIMHNACTLTELPEFRNRKLDRMALRAGALYHEAGWLCQLRQGVIKRSELLCRPTSDTQRDLGAALLEQSLADLLKPRTLAAAGMLIRQLNDRHVRSLETRLLSDADNLDDIGTLALCAMIRRSTFEGKGLSHLIQTWQRRREFHFWEARIKKSFRLEAVQQIAFQRLTRLDDFMESLARQCTGEDVSAMVRAATPES